MSVCIGLRACTKVTGDRELSRLRAMVISNLSTSHLRGKDAQLIRYSHSDPGSVELPNRGCELHVMNERI